MTIEEFNKMHKVGDKCVYKPISLIYRSDPINTKIISMAWDSGDGQKLVRLSGVSQSVSINQLSFN